MFTSVGSEVGSNFTLTRIGFLAYIVVVLLNVLCLQLCFVFTTFCFVVCFVFTTHGSEVGSNFTLTSIG